MSIWQSIKDVFSRRESVLWNNIFGSGFGNWIEKRLPFADCVFLSITNKVTDLCNDVEWKPVTILDDEHKALFADFKALFETWGQVIMNKIYEQGYVVIGYKGIFRILRDDEYKKQDTTNGAEVVIPTDSEMEVYVMRSPTYKMTRKSDKAICNPFLEFLDNIINASNTVSSRLGALIVMSPESQTGLPTATTLTKEQKEELEKKTQEEYGSLSKQKQLMVLPRTMRTSVVSLAGLDLKTIDKAKMAILAICDAIGVPANQVALIDANSSKSLANGTELREGDFARYQTFERMLTATWQKMADEMGIALDYSIYNKPQRQQTII